mmetsp:Transcript_84169/g.167994  ORF Transcript_84169/g.167994 Transcript_84169/m.167994 type:complete len:202 (-) Transcript_84169:347-952(-)
MSCSSSSASSSGLSWETRMPSIAASSTGGGAPPRVERVRSWICARSALASAASSKRSAAICSPAVAGGWGATAATKAALRAAEPTAAAVRWAGTGMPHASSTCRRPSHACSCTARRALAPRSCMLLVSSSVFVSAVLSARASSLDTASTCSASVAASLLAASRRSSAPSAFTCPSSERRAACCAIKASTCSLSSVLVRSSC